MKVKTKFYDEVEVGTEEIIHFSHGLPGFESDQNIFISNPKIRSLAASNRVTDQRPPLLLSLPLWSVPIMTLNSRK